MDTSAESISANQRTRRSWRQRWWKYIAILRTSVASNLAYVNEVIFRSLMLVTLVFVLSQLWKTTFAARGTTSLSGFSIANLVWYLVAAEAMALSLPQLTRRIDQEVRSGQLAYLLSRPCSYVLYNYAHYLGERLVRFVLNSIMGALLALVIVGPPQLTWSGVAAWPLAVLLAMSIEFIAYFCIGLLAFWTEETQSFSFLFSRFTLVLGGVLAPLAIFPQPLRSIAQALPFSTILYGPANTLVHFEWQTFVGLLVQQTLTLAIGGLFLLWLYHIAMKKVNINGG